MRICALQIFASLALACIPMDRVAAAEDRRSHATTADKPAFMIGGVGYFHRWSQNDQYEFTPTGQDDLEKWSDMITINVYRTAHDGDALAVKANAVLENYKSHGGRVSELIPSLARQIGPQSTSLPLFLAGQNFSRRRLAVLNWWTALAARLFIRIAFTARKSATK